ncbi:hypothetical protein P3T76_015663 [Phytophthora citrophthora]|uniref:Uncharacterized protein n=1 Tax=Phytophthora citrophthora TaxID=4793 RepID=A0AAD9FZ10_9STRA|nr:hypothetical protein P3T76_015663 [Phytophthora citrophthora]
MTPVTGIHWRSEPEALQLEVITPSPRFSEIHQVVINVTCELSARRRIAGEASASTRQSLHRSHLKLWRRFASDRSRELRSEVLQLALPATL